MKELRQIKVVLEENDEVRKMVDFTLVSRKTLDGKAFSVITTSGHNVTVEHSTPEGALQQLSQMYKIV